LLFDVEGVIVERMAREATGRKGSLKKGGSCRNTGEKATIPDRLQDGQDGDPSGDASQQ
jgi:hypothetical protein